MAYGLKASSCDPLTVALYNIIVHAIFDDAIVAYFDEGGDGVPLYCCKAPHAHRKVYPIVLGV